MDKSLEVRDIFDRHQLAVDIANMYSDWNTMRQPWRNDKMELRNYIFATDTRSTTNAQLDWKNSTTIPKLCQIRDNLHSNYLAALFPRDNWLKWEGYSEEDEIAEKRTAITQYMQNKVRQSDFRETVSRLIYDYIDYGNAFADVEWVEDYITDPQTGEKIVQYIGPKLVRISPLDIVFNPTAASFANSPKITRSIKSLGQLRAELATMPELKEEAEKVLARMHRVRQEVESYSEADVDKAAGFQVDGYGDLKEYYGSNYVEILKFEGDIVDDQGNFLRNHIITVLDRSYIIEKKPNPSWLGKSTKFHVGWRLRPDNLYSMGPLDNLVGMQYRIDHLENLKADALDLNVHPPIKIRGEVEEFVYAPFEEIFLGEEGDVELMAPNVAAFQVNNEIQLLEMKMEEMAGAPKQAMGIRTPGEKTAFEVQSLDNAASRIFQEKTTTFEVQLVEKGLNYMLELARRNLNEVDIIRTMDDQLGLVNFLKITKEDLASAGKLRPIGARHFAAQNQAYQNMLNVMNSAIGQDPDVKVHISGKKTARFIEEMLDLERFDLVSDHVRVHEQTETQQLMQAAQEELAVEQAQPETPEALEAEIQQNIRGV